MALPTTTPETPESTFQRVVSTAQIVSDALRSTQRLIAAGGPVYTDHLINLHRNLTSARQIGIGLQNVPGLAEYARSLPTIDDPTYDIDAEFAASVAAGTAITQWLSANMPSDGQGGFVGWVLQEDGTLARRDIPVSALAPLQALIATALTTFAERRS